MPSRHDIVSFQDPPVPPGESPWVDGARSAVGIEVVDPDPSWPAQYGVVADRVREVLGARVLALDHVGSTAVPGLAAKPVIDVDLVVADSDDEPAYVPALVGAGYRLRVREPWWFGHRCLLGSDPTVNLHVFGPDAPEPWKHRILRDHLRSDDADRERYAGAKRAAAAASNEVGEDVMAYNARKERVVREIYARAFAAAGLTPGTAAPH